MALVGFPFQSNFTGYDEYENPIFDRAINAIFYRNFWLKYWTDGVFILDDSTVFTLTPIEGMTVSVKLGECHIRGVTAQPDDEISQNVTFSSPSSTADRTDRVVIRVDFENNREVTISLRENWQSGNTLTRNSNVWELAIADVIIRRSATSIRLSDITDLRLNSELCGVVTEPIRRTNTTVFFSQLEAMMANFSSQASQQLTNQQTSWQTQMTNQQTNWQTQMGNQQTGWQTQMGDQESGYENREDNWNTWFSGAQSDIVRAAQFNFWNYASMPGNTYKTEYPADGSIITLVSRTSDGTPVAAGKTTYPTDGSIVYEQEVYQSDGVSLQSHITAITTYGADGSINIEVVNQL